MNKKTANNSENLGLGNISPDSDLGVYPVIIQRDLFEDQGEFSEFREKAMVYKRNELIESHAAMSAAAMKVQTAIFALINPYDYPDPSASYVAPSFSFTISEFASLCGHSRQYIHKNIRDVTAELQSKVITLKKIDHDYEEAVRAENRAAKQEGREPKDLVRPDIPNDKGFVNINLFLDSSYDDTEGIIKFTIHPKAMGYVLFLKSNYTAYLLRCVMKMRSYYSIRIYELLRKVLSLKWVREGQGFIQKKYELAEFRKLIGLSEGKYKYFKDLQRHILEGAKREFETSDLAFDYFVPERQKLIKNSDTGQFEIVTFKPRAAVKTIMFIVYARASFGINAPGSEASWTDQILHYIPTGTLKSLRSKFGEERVERNAFVVLDKLELEQSAIHNVPAYLRKLCELDVAVYGDVLNASAYEGVKKAFVKERLLTIWPDLDEYVRQDFKDKGFNSQFVSDLYTDYLKATGQSDKQLLADKKQKARERLMNIHDMDW